MAKINEEIPDCPFSPERFNELVRESFSQRGFSCNQTTIQTGKSKSESITIGGAVITSGQLAGGAATTTTATTHEQLTWNPFEFSKKVGGVTVG